MSGHSLNFFINTIWQITEEVIFDKEIIASALALYEGVDYSALIEGTQFMIMEGGNKVGEGVVNEIFQHIPAKEFKK